MDVHRRPTDGETTTSSTPLETDTDEEEEMDEIQNPTLVQPAAAAAEGGSVGASGKKKRRGDYLKMDARGIWDVVSHRTTLLVSLLLLQSLSQFILERYEKLISGHVIIPLFLTMLVGAGGNAGNQATVRAITGLVAKEFKPHHFLLVLRKEVVCGLISSILLGIIGFLRVYLLYGTDHLFYSTVAITASLFCIVMTSIVLGCSLPFLLGRIGMDREHAAPMIQVAMDIIGVFITCALCTIIIPESEHRTHAH